MAPERTTLHLSLYTLVTKMPVNHLANVLFVFQQENRLESHSDTLCPHSHVIISKKVWKTRCNPKISDTVKSHWHSYNIQQGTTKRDNAQKRPPVTELRKSHFSLLQFQILWNILAPAWFSGWNLFVCWTIWTKCAMGFSVATISIPGSIVYQ